MKLLDEQAAWDEAIRAASSIIADCAPRAPALAAPVQVRLIFLASRIAWSSCKSL